MHADHVSGLPGLLVDILGGHGGTQSDCEAGVARAHVRGPLDVYGPRGITEYLRTSWRTTYSSLAAHVRIHELLWEGELPSGGKPVANELEVPPLRMTGGRWTLEDVEAAPIKHTVPCLGYVVRERSIPREVAMTIKQTHKDPQKALRRLKAGHAVDDHKAEETQVVILGDTSDASGMLELLTGPVALLVHESTNAWLGDGTMEKVRARAASRGHSTPEVAGALARRMNAKKLVLCHFSSRYPGDVRHKPMMQQFEHLARLGDEATEDAVHAGLDRDGLKVIASWDGMSVDV
ncbi:hypothetical protein PYCC9005_005365 [Savitreella phatthalungensis]